MFKYKIQLVQFNNKYGSQVYLPYSIGVLKSYAVSFKSIRNKFIFNDFLFIREDIDVLINKIGCVDILGLSCYIWNWQLSLKLAEKYKEKYPDCLIILGGPQIPNNHLESIKLIQKHNYIDILVHGEGEITFIEILNNFKSDFKNINGITFKNKSDIIKTDNRNIMPDINIVPSPYLSGVFDNLLNDTSYLWMITWETNRGCPFKCTFCDWGKTETKQKIRKFDHDRLLKELDYFSEKKVNLIFGADANFGIFSRDKEYAVKMAENKAVYGYPKQFRVCFTKNSTEKVFELSRILTAAGMDKGVSISMQSLNSQTLENIQRTNIKMDFFKDLQQKFISHKLITYTELILPLPGETYESFIEGIDLLLENHQHSGIIIYNCSIMPNAVMGENSYQQEHGIETVEIPIFQVHSDLVKKQDITEKEIIVVATKTMNKQQYIQTFKYAWMIQCMHTLGILQIIAIILRYNNNIKYSELYTSLIKYGEENPDTIIGQELCILNNLLNNVLNGGEFGQSVPEFEDISWPPEEASYLRISEKSDVFYKEIKEFLSNHFNIESNLLKDIILYQKHRNIRYDNQFKKMFDLKYDINTYFENCKVGIIEPLEKQKNIIIVYPNDIYNKKDFSRNIIWYGRKGGVFFYNTEII